MLSLRTNSAALAAQNSLAKTNEALSISMTRLSTGYRINSAKDDAAGLQIATRLKYQQSGIQTAMRNSQNSMSMLQTADGALDETTNILIRMKDLATQAADSSTTKDDQKALQSEFDNLVGELSNIMTNTKFGGQTLFTGDGSGGTGKLASAAMTFQIGESSSEKIEADISTALETLHGNLKTMSTNYNGSTYAGAALTTAGTEISSAASAKTAISNLTTALDNLSQVRSQIGATSNRLEHSYSNLTNIFTNVKNAQSSIMDTDFATETANMTSNQMLLQAASAMLKQSNSQSQLVISLLQA